MSDLALIVQQLIRPFPLLSLHTTFYDSPNVRANCRSIHEVELAVNIWEDYDDREAFIVEVTITYHRYVTQILYRGIQRTGWLIATQNATAKRSRKEGNLSSDVMPAPSTIPDALRIITDMLLSHRTILDLLA